MRAADASRRYGAADPDFAVGYSASSSARAPASSPARSTSQRPPARQRGRPLRPHPRRPGQRQLRDQLPPRHPHDRPRAAHRHPAFTARTYGADTPAFTARYAGFVLGEDAGDLDGALAFATDAGRQQPGRRYYRVTACRPRQRQLRHPFAPGRAGSRPGAADRHRARRRPPLRRRRPRLRARYDGFVLGEGAGDLPARSTSPPAPTAPARSAATISSPAASRAATTRSATAPAPSASRPAPLTVTALDATRPFGARDPVFAARYRRLRPRRGRGRSHRRPRLRDPHEPRQPGRALRPPPRRPRQPQLRHQLPPRHPHHRAGPLRRGAVRRQRRPPRRLRARHAAAHPRRRELPHHHGRGAARARQPLRPHLFARARSSELAPPGADRRPPTPRASSPPPAASPRPTAATPAAAARSAAAPTAAGGRPSSRTTGSPPGELPRPAAPSPRALALGAATAADAQSAADYLPREPGAGLAAPDLPEPPDPSAPPTSPPPAGDRRRLHPARRQARRRDRARPRGAGADLGAARRPAGVDRHPRRDRDADRRRLPRARLRALPGGAAGADHRRRRRAHPGDRRLRRPRGGRGRRARPAGRGRRAALRAGRRRPAAAPAHARAQRAPRPRHLRRRGRDPARTLARRPSPPPTSPSS